MPIGICAHPDKGVLLLPPGAPDPLHDAPIRRFSRVTRTSVRIAGCHVGTHSDCVADALDMVAKKQPLLDALVRLSRTEALTAMKLLGTSAQKGFTYYLSITPTDIALPACEDLDVRVRAAAEAMLSPPDFVVQDMQPDRQHRAQVFDSLPTRTGGAGQTPATVTQPCAFLATVQTCLHHPALATARRTLGPAIDAAFIALFNQVGDDPASALAIAAVIPTSSAALLEPDLSSSHHSPPQWRRVQSVLTSVVAGRRRARLLGRSDPRTNKPTPAATLADMAGTQLMIRRSQQTRMFQAPLHHVANQVASQEFVDVWRYATGRTRLTRVGRPTALLPPPASNPPADADEARFRAADADWVALRCEVCSLRHAQPELLSPTADHCISCVSTFKERSRTHNSFSQVIIKFAREAGCTVDREPSTAALLQHQFTALELRSLCPKDASKANKVRSAAIYQALTKLATMPPGAPNVEAVVLAIKRIIADTPAATKGVRLDLAIVFPNGSEVWIDFAGVHPTTRASVGGITNWLRTNNLVDFVAAGVAANNPDARAPSPSVVATVRAKEERYRLLMHLVVQQVHSRMRPRAPILCAAVITHLGELSPHLIELIERLTSAAASNYRPGPLNDGAPRRIFANRFRTELKDALMAANARGWGRALRAAGNPMPGWVCGELDLLLEPWDDHSY